MFTDVRDAVEHTVALTDTTSPGPDCAVYQELYRRYRALYPALKAEFRAIAEIAEDPRTRRAEPEGA